MVNDDRLSLLARAVDEVGSQAKVARQLGYSPTAVNQALRGTYAGAMDALLARVEEVYSSREIDCPVLGLVPLCKCVEERREPFSSANPLRVRMFRTCRRCVNNTDIREE